MATPPSGLRVLLVVLVLGAPLAGRAEIPRRVQIGRCAAFVKRLHDRGSARGVVRHDLYEGLSGWIALRAGVAPEAVDGLAVGATPDAEACEGFGLPARPLQALEGAVSGLPPESLKPAAEGCLAALKLLDGLSARPGLEPVLALLEEQRKSVGRLLGYVPKDKKPGAGAVATRVEELVREAGSNPWASPTFGRALENCRPLGVDTDRLRRTHGVP